MECIKQEKCALFLQFFLDLPVLVAHHRVPPAKIDVLYFKGTVAQEMGYFSYQFVLEIRTFWIAAYGFYI
jgi:hypothetical protein